MTDAFDIDDLKSTETDELAIVHPRTGAPTTWIWTLAGPGHPATVEMNNRNNREAQATQRKRELAASNGKAWIPPERSADETREETARSFAGRVLGWTPARINGADYPFSAENVVKLLLDPNYDRIYLQLIQFFRADASFTKASVEGSPPSPSENSP